MASGRQSSRRVWGWTDWAALGLGAVFLAGVGLSVLKSVRRASRSKSVSKSRSDRTPSTQGPKHPRFTLIKHLSKVSGLTASELEGLLSFFEKKAQHDFISKEEFSVLMHQANIEDEAMINSMFSAWDQNHDGKIDLKELMFAFVIFSRGSEQDKLRFIFKAYDLDQDGFITVEDLIEVFRAFFKAEGLIADEQELDNKVRTLAGEVLFKGDRNRDNSLNEDEFVRLMGSPEIEQLEHSSIHFAQRVLEWFGVDVRGIASQ